MVGPDKAGEQHGFQDPQIAKSPPEITGAFFRQFQRLQFRVSKDRLPRLPTLPPPVHVQASANKESPSLSVWETSS